MKWVKVAIGAVIAILSIGIITSNIYNMTQETVKQKVFTFKILSYDEELDEGTVTTGTYQKINNLFKPSDNSYNLDIYVNDIFIDRASYVIGVDDEIIIFIELTGESLGIYEDDTIFISDYPFDVNDVIRLEDDPVVVPPQLTGISATLILLAPLIFAGGVLAYLLNKQNY